MIKNDPHKPRLVYSNVVRWRQQLFLYVRSSNPLFSGLLFIVLALLWSFLLFLRFSYAAWSEPSAAPPGNETNPPIDISSTAQNKSGALTIGSTTTYTAVGMYAPIY